MNLRSYAAYTLARIASHATRTFRSGGGSALPGLIALKIHSDILRELREKISGPQICVSGTNGKTTTANLIASGLHPTYTHILHNKNGSNLERGLVSAFISTPKSSYQGAVYECDEAALVSILPKVQPQYLVLTNLFRDQLDRYGEIESTRRKWEGVLSKVDWPLTVIYNATDPQLHYLAQTKNEHLTFMPLVLKNVTPNTVKHSPLNPLTNIHCPQCNTILTFSDEILIGQGTYNCPQCQFSNTNLHSSIVQIPGHLGINHALAQYILKELNITLKEESDLNIFGRGETLKIGGFNWQIVLIKNPNGAYTSIHQTDLHKISSIIFALNDNFADGTDVSWIWDIPLEELSLPKDKTYFTTGTRREEIRLRLKYVDIATRDVTEWSQLIPIAGDKVIFCTYTAMMQLQKWLADNNYKKEYWQT